MKKLLALVLALVMTLSLAVVGSNAAFKDAEKVNASYAEAVDVLAGMKVFQGYPDNSFQPEGSITRAEVAAIVYRLYTGDVADKQASLYATYNKFNDMDGAAWAKGYIGYCGNAGLIKGYDAKTFGPSDKVTGYQALAMILRAVGYDKNDEFTGAQWQLRVASTAQQLGILKNVKGVDLNAAASRELVAELLFRTAAEVPMVTYTPALGYTNLTAILNGKTNATLGEKNFGLTKVADTDDKWGRPAYSWTNGKTGSAKVTYATVTETPVATYTKAVAECDIAHDAGLKADKTYTLYVNGVKSTDVVQLLDTVGKMGAQGRLTEVYEDRIVMIDTFLAVVTAVKDATYDAQGHLNTHATITLSVNDGSKDRSNNVVPSTYVLTNGETNYTYAVGDYVLLNAYTAAGNRTTSTTVTKADITNLGVYGEVVGKADSVEGTQTVVWFNAGKHTVNGTTYDDALKFILDEAGSKTTQHTWFFDSYGNLIGDVEVAAQYNYAVLTKLWWNNIGAEGTGYAMGTLKYMDGSENTVTISKIDGLATTYAYASDYGFVKINGSATNNAFAVATYPATNAALDNVAGGLDYIHGHLFKVGTLADSTVTLDKVAEEITSDYIVNKYAYIVDKANQNNVKLDTETVFLVRTGAEATGFTYTAYTGMNELPTFKAGAKVDYVLGTNGVAKYVYIIGETADSTSKNFVLVTSNAYSAVLKTAGGVSYWELTLPVPAEDGSVVTLKVIDDDADMSTVPAVVQQLTNVSSVGKLFYVTYTNGYAVSTKEITKTDSNYQYDAVGTPDGRVMKLEKDAKYADGAIQSVSNAMLRFNVTGATTVVGTIEADMTNKDVYVIFNAKNLYAEKVYVLSYSTAIDTPTDKAPTLTVATASTNGVAPIDIDGTNSIKVAYGANTVTLSLNYPVGSGINSVKMTVNGIEQTATNNSTGVYNYTYAINSADLQRGHIVVSLSTSTDGGKTVAGSASYQITVTGSLIQH